KDDRQVHISIADTSYKLGKVYISLNNYKQAKIALNEALKIRRHLFGSANSSIAACYYMLGRVAYSCERYPQSSQLVRKSILTSFSANDRHAALKYLGRLLFILRNYQDDNINKEVKEEILPICIEKLGKTHSMTKEIETFLPPRERSWKWIIPGTFVIFGVGLWITNKYFNRKVQSENDDRKSLSRTSRATPQQQRWTSGLLL
ncbi:MAG: hypothetical protein K1060chlam2_01484, partial [Chlamydiae bacterium]|nr:hypothetical protein [Chlamydiota bacterium]